MHLRAVLPRGAGALFSAALIAAPASASSLSGLVVDRNGVPVASVVVIVRDSVTKTQVHVTGNSTDPTGHFRISINDGDYDIQFEPPFGDRLADAESDGVVVSGDTDTGTTRLDAGVVLSGRVVDENAVGVSDVSQLARSSFDGVRIPTHGDHTDSIGFFEFVGPTGTLDVDDEPPQSTRLVGARRVGIAVAADTNLGSIVVLPGVQLSGRILGSGASPVADANVQVIGTFTGENPPLANSHSASDGTFAVIVPAMDLEISIVPPTTARLAGARIDYGPISADTNIGDVTLSVGSDLSGVVRQPDGGGADRILVKIFGSAGAFVPTRDDYTDATGSYLAVTPKTTVDVFFTPPFDMPWKHQLITGKDLSSDETLDVQLVSTVVLADISLSSPGYHPGDALTFTLVVRNMDGVARTIQYAVDGSVPESSIERSIIAPTKFFLHADGSPVTVGTFQTRIPPKLPGRFTNIPLRVTMKIFDPATLKLVDFDFAQFRVY